MPKDRLHRERYRRLTLELKKLRKARKLSQRAVSEALGLWTTYVSKVEQGERRIDVVELADLCEVYGITLAQFIKRCEF